MNRGLLSIVLLAGMVAGLISGCATTQEKQAATADRKLCAVLDTDKDGRISKEEFMARATDKEKALEVFEKCDTGQKGYLTYDEFISPPSPMPPVLNVTPWPVLRPVR